MKAELRRVNGISEGVLASIHGMTYSILELYNPELNISFNVVSGWNCFETYEDRYKNSKVIRTIDLPEIVKDILASYISVSKEMDKPKDWFEEEFKKDMNDFKEMQLKK